MSGDEPLQVEESLDRIRTAARGEGFTERTVLEVETGFDWELLAAGRDNLSLFAERRLLDLRLPTGRPGDKGSRALIAFTESLDPERPRGVA